MYSNKDFERLFIRYKVESVPKGESIQQFCHRNEVPKKLCSIYCYLISENTLSVLGYGGKYIAGYVFYEWAK